MGEIPMEWATLGSARGSIEVYRQDLQSLDVIKAVCDSTGDQGPGFYGFFKGQESDCSFLYSMNATAVITDQNILSTNKDSYDRVTH
jgi:hypothetical protein